MIWLWWWQVLIYNQLCISVSKDFSYLIKQRRTWWNVTFCGQGNFIWKYLHSQCSCLRWNQYFWLLVYLDSKHEMSRDLDRASRRSNINVSQWCSLFIDISMSFTYRHDVMFTSFTPWLFQHLPYKWNISFYKDNWWGWVEENSVNLIDNIECKYKEWNSYFKLELDDEKH